jgi:hypothetical protein
MLVFLRSRHGKLVRAARKGGKPATIATGWRAEPGHRAFLEYPVAARDNRYIAKAILPTEMG